MRDFGHNSLEKTPNRIMLLTPKPSPPARTHIADLCGMKLLSSFRRRKTTDVPQSFPSGSLGRSGLMFSSRLHDETNFMIFLLYLAYQRCWMCQPLFFIQILNTLLRINQNPVGRYYCRFIPSVVSQVNMHFQKYQKYSDYSLLLSGLSLTLAKTYTVYHKAK